MKISLLEVLLENISSFILLSSWDDLSYEPARRYYHMIEEILKLLKSAIDAIVDSNINPEEPILEACGELGQSVLGLRELLMNWNPLMSKVYFVPQIEVLISKTQTTSVYIFNLLKSSDHLPLELNASSLKISAQKIKQIDGVQASAIITRAIGEQEDGLKPTSEILAKISDYLSLHSNQEILIEAAALYKLKENAVQIENTEEVEFINKLIFLITHMHERVMAMKQAQSSNPVSIPSDFCCPLSLDLMTDPVIVSSGQTYERTYFQKWIDLGLTTCPKTRQPLSNTTLVPNYSIKALITNWCEIHNVKLLPDSMKSLNSTPLFGSNINFQLSSDDPPPSSEGSLSLKNNVDGFESSEKRHLESDNYLSGFGEADESSSDGHNRSASISSVHSHNQTVWHRPSNLSGVEAQVKNHIEELHSDSIEIQREATYQIRLLAKQVDNRIIIANCGAIKVLVNLLLSTDLNIQEHAVTALLNLSINNENKTTIANTDAIEPLIHVLETGSPEAKGNSAATLYSLSVIEENKAMIGRSRAIIPLVDLLGNGTPRGKRDAAIALFNLSILHENKARIVQAGAVKYLMELMEPAGGMVDKAVAVLSNLSTIPEGRAAVCLEGGIPYLVEVVELGSARGKEHAAAALLHLCVGSSRFCNMVLHEGAVPPLVALSQSGTPRAKQKAQKLLNYVRNQNQMHGGGIGKG